MAFQSFFMRLRAFMSGRRGLDALGGVLLALALFLRALARRLLCTWLYPLALLPLVLFILRALSRNIPSRRKENDAFLRIWYGVKSAALKAWQALFKAWNACKRAWRACRDAWERFLSRKQYAYPRCPACKMRLRVPRGKGRIRVTCPKCGNRFEKTT